MYSLPYLYKLFPPKALSYTITTNVSRETRVIHNILDVSHKKLGVLRFNLMFHVKHELYYSIYNVFHVKQTI